MARQIIAEQWKVLETIRKNDVFLTKTTALGKFTAYTAHSKMAARFPGYRYVEKPFHGFGGYWVSPEGNTAECVPA